MFGNKKGEKKLTKYCCEKCDFNTCSKNDYNRHINTKKHNSVNPQCLAMEKTQKNSYICECGKTYMDNSGLWRHKNKSKCTNKTPELDDESGPESDDEYDIIKSKKNEELITYLIKENAEFKQLLIDQNNKLFELYKNAGNNNHNHTNSHNKSFNLQFFLNETCKDALNISDFVKSIKPSLEDLETTGRLGYVEGVSNIILKNLNTLDSNSTQYGTELWT